MNQSGSTIQTRIAGLLGILLLLGGCATSREVVTLNAKQVSNPTSGKALKMVSVTDNRAFQVKPSTPSIPSLMDDDIGNKALTSRAIARKRNGFGQALGDVLLPEGQTVARLTEDALSRAFRESGYRVLTAADAGYAEAVPVTAQVDQFWAWLTPGFWAITVESKINVRVKGGDGVLNSETPIEGSAKQGMQIVTSDDWMNMVERAIDDLVTNIKAKLGGK